MKKLHPSTKKAISKYAKLLLALYRKNCKNHPTSLARFYARVKANQSVNGNTYVEIAYRQLTRYPRI